MAFDKFTSPFINAYRGYGRFGGLASAGAGLAAIAAPFYFRNEDRDYAATAALTTPLIAAGYVAAPDLYNLSADFTKQWTGFWKSKPFSFEGGLPKWKPGTASYTY